MNGLPTTKTPVRSPVLLIAAWLCAAAAGMMMLAAYTQAPGAAASAGPKWPAGSALKLDADRMTLVMMAHPQCPCTRATLGELETLLAKFPGRLATSVVFAEPVDATREWVEGANWHAARRIPEISVLTDKDSQEARRFGAQVSGQVFLFHPEGRLAFGGGITASRGHSGDNVGRGAIESILKGIPAANAAPVFGCSLY